jgi:mannosyltransferase
LADEWLEAACAAVRERRTAGVVPAARCALSRRTPLTRFDANVTVLIDGIVFALQRHGGISVCFRELLMRLQRDAVPTLLALDGKLQQDPPRSDSALAVLRRPARPLERYLPCRVPAAVAHAVFHSSYYRRPSRRTLPTVVTVHDFAYERTIEGPRRWVHSAQKFAAIRAAQTVVCISATTLADLQELVGQRSGQQVRVIHNGVSDAFHPIASPPPERPFALFVGQRRGYKNFGLALRALAFLPDLELHCVGGGLLQPNELAETPAAVRDRVKHLGFISDARLNELYNQALCLVYPSRYEGFGIPVAEAMRAGCPVVAISCKAVVETGGDALTVSADEPREFAAAINSVADAAHRTAVVGRGKVVAARYSWEANYQAMREVYRELSSSG